MVQTRNQKSANKAEGVQTRSRAVTRSSPAVSSDSGRKRKQEQASPRSTKRKTGRQPRGWAAAEPAAAAEHVAVQPERDEAGPSRPAIGDSKARKDRANMAKSPDEAAAEQQGDGAGQPEDQVQWPERPA